MGRHKGFGTLCLSGEKVETVFAVLWLTNHAVKIVLNGTAAFLQEVTDCRAIVSHSFCPKAYLLRTWHLTKQKVLLKLQQNTAVSSQMPASVSRGLIRDTRSNFVWVNLAGVFRYQHDLAYGEVLW